MLIDDGENRNLFAILNSYLRIKPLLNEYLGSAHYTVYFLPHMAYKSPPYTTPSETEDQEAKTESSTALLHSIFNEASKACRICEGSYRLEYRTVPAETDFITSTHDSVSGVESVHPEFNYYPADRSVIDSICERESLSIVPVDNLVCDSLFCAVILEDGSCEKYVFIDTKADEAYSLFLLLHELGHYFIHVKPLLVSKKLFFRSDSEVLQVPIETNISHYEKQADVFAFIGLLPSHLMLGFLNKGNLNQEEVRGTVLSWFGWSNVKTNSTTWKLVDWAVRWRIPNFLKYYRRYLRTLSAVFNYPHLSELDVAYLSRRVYPDLPWVRLDDNFHIISCNENYADVLGHDIDNLLGTNVLDYVHEESSSSSAAEVARRRELCGLSQLYVRHKGGDRPFNVCLVQSWKVVEPNVGYVGSWALVVPRSQEGLLLERAFNSRDFEESQNSDNLPIEGDWLTNKIMKNRRDSTDQIGDDDLPSVRQVFDKVSSALDETISRKLGILEVDDPDSEMIRDNVARSMRRYNEEAGRAIGEANESESERKVGN